MNNDGLVEFTSFAQRGDVGPIFAWLEEIGALISPRKGENILAARRFLLTPTQEIEFLLRGGDEIQITLWEDIGTASFRI